MNLVLIGAAKWFLWSALVLFILSVSSLPVLQSIVVSIFGGFLIGGLKFVYLWEGFIRKEDIRLL